MIARRTAGPQPSSDRRTDAPLPPWTPRDEHADQPVDPVAGDDEEDDRRDPVDDRREHVLVPVEALEGLRTGRP